MTMFVSRVRAALLLGVAPALMLPAIIEAKATARDDVISLGRDSTREPCTATRAWSDAATPDRFAAAYFITCRNVSASRPLGTIRLVSATAQALAPIDATMICGAESAVSLTGGKGTARRCFDRALGTETVRIDVTMGKLHLVADAAPSLLGPLEEGVAILAGRKSASRDPGRETSPTIVLASLAAVPAGPGQDQATAIFDPAVALAQGIGLNHKGLHVDASRVLNDALSRLPASANPGVRAELLLEAGLADSNISFGESAADHFAEADRLIASSPEAHSAFLLRKREAYNALDLLNRRQFRRALAALDRLVLAKVSADQPLQDASIVRRLNQANTTRTDATSAIAVPDAAELSQIVLDAQANWARSVSLLALDDDAGASAALDASTRSYALLQRERIDQAQVLWLGARIARQRGRLDARRKDWTSSLANFDRAIDYLRRGALATAGTGNEPTIAETELERASVFAKSGANADAIRNQYAAAVDTLIASSTTGGALPTGMEGYLDLLVAESNSGARADTYERFFRAVQASGEPAVARQLSQLQNVVNADPALGSQVRDRAEVERDVTRLRYAIADAARTGASVDALNKDRAAAEQKLLAIDTALAGSDRFRSVDDRPASVADIRTALAPGEAFLKIATLSGRAYGIFISADETFVYRIADGASLAQLDKLGQQVRASIDGSLDAGKLVPFETGRAYALFRLLTGPSTASLLRAKALVIDPAGPLKALPIGTLVTAFDPAVKNADPFDYSNVAFLSGQMTISTALTPRSFLNARALPGSNAAHAFLGLGEHQQPAASSDGRPINVGFSCSVPYELLAKISREFAPISKHELVVAANALGQPDAPMIVDAAFSDTALDTRGDLADYQVLHFATHGLAEGQWGCAKSPPALVASFGDANSDGLISFSEIARLRLNANLVVLSACDTASGVKSEGLARSAGQEEAGSTLEGLVRAFLTANARAVLATYWQVSAEQESEDFIKTFYTSGKSTSIGAALQAAQLRLMRQPAYSHPFYWAPYFVVGDSTKPMLLPPGKPPVVAAR